MNLNERLRRRWGMVEPVSPRVKLFRHTRMLAHHRNWKDLLVHHRILKMVHHMNWKLDPADKSLTRKNELYKHLMG